MQEIQALQLSTVDWPVYFSTVRLVTPSRLRLSPMLASCHGRHGQTSSPGREPAAARAGLSAKVDRR